MKKVLFIVLATALYACSNDPAPVEPPPAPVATAATFINPDHFTANWNESTDATGYELEIATDKDFADITNIEKGVVSGTILWSMESKTQYFYRVRATITGGKTSPYSNIISLFTLPVPPVAQPATNVLGNGFTANWNEVPGISNYLLYLSLDNFTSSPPVYVANYEGKEVNGLTHEVAGLTSNTLYFYAVKAKGDESVSFFSNAIIVETGN